MSWLKEKRIAEWDQMLDVNVKGLLYGIGAILPIMQNQKHGHIINIGSVASLNVNPGNVVYCGTKYAVRAITNGLREELASEKSNVRVTAIYPGAVDTELTSHIADPTMKVDIQNFYRENAAIPAERVAIAIKDAINMPEDTSLNDIVIRPVNQVF